MSYHHLPPGLDEFYVVERDVKYDTRHAGEQTDATERLVMNFDPQQRNSHIGTNQTTAEDWI